MSGITDIRSRLTRLFVVSDSVSSAMLLARDADTKADNAVKMAAANSVDLGEVVIPFTSLVSVSLGVRAFTISVPGAKLGDRIYPHPSAALPAGYAVLGLPYVPENGKIEVRVLTPVLTAGQIGSVILSLHIFARRAVT